MHQIKQITFAATMAGLLSFAPNTRYATAADEIAIGQPDLSAISENDLAKAAAVACNNSVLGQGPIQRYKLAFLGAWTQYNQVSCAPRGPGSWKLMSQDKCDGTKNCGQITYGIIRSYPLSGGACPGHRYDFAAICYKWIEHSNAKITDTVRATWKPPTSATSDQPLIAPIKVPIVYPTDEETQARGWDASGLGQWTQIVKSTKDPTFDWSLNSVREISGPGANKANDTCWCAGSAIDPFYRITGGTWEVDDQGKWEFDHVGWCTAHSSLFCQGAGAIPVQYYRAKRRAPCGTTFPQQMQFRATNVGGPWQNYGEVNTLGGSFNYRSVTSTRAGETTTRLFSPQAAKPRIDCTSFKLASDENIAAAKLGDTTTVSDPRPVAAAIEEIERVTGKAITYEDPPFLYKAQTAPMVKAAREDSLLVPKGGSLSFALPQDASIEAAVSATQAMVEKYNAARGAATFSVLQGELTHVVPRQATNASGQLVSVTPVLSTRITLDAKSRSALDLLAEICKAVSAASGQKVGLGTVPFNSLARRKIDIGARNQPAREVLQQIITANGATMSWRLLYDPGEKSYFLNIPVIE